MRLNRPVGLNELRLIFETEMTAFPARLPEQPIFYPVLNAPYAVKIARDWNAKNEMRAGYVTEFDVEDTYAARVEPHIVGSREHEERWVPAEELAEFNAHIQGKIRAVDVYFGEGFIGYIPQRFVLAGKNATEQAVGLGHWLEHSSFEVWCEIEANRLVVFLHIPYWTQRDLEPEGVSMERKDNLIRFIRRAWTERCANMPLCYAVSA